jgi:hypothetical protein
MEGFTRLISSKKMARQNRIEKIASITILGYGRFGVYVVYNQPQLTSFTLPAIGPT